MTSVVQVSRLNPQDAAIACSYMFKSSPLLSFISVLFLCQVVHRTLNSLLSQLAAILLVLCPLSSRSGCSVNCDLYYGSCSITPSATQPMNSIVRYSLLWLWWTTRNLKNLPQQASIENEPIVIWAQRRCGAFIILHSCLRQRMRPFASQIFLPLLCWASRQHWNCDWKLALVSKFGLLTPLVRVSTSVRFNHRVCSWA